MYYPDVGNPRYFIKNKCGFLVAGWIGNKGKELHGSYEYVGSKSEGLKLLQKYKSEWIKSETDKKLSQRSTNSTNMKSI